MVLRGAGFPAAAVLQLAAPDTAAQADRLLELEDAAAERRRAAIAVIDGAMAAPPGRDDPEGRRHARLRAMRRKLAAARPPGEIAERAVARTLRGLQTVETEIEAARAELGRRYEGELARVSGEIARAAAADRFREAVAWQSPDAVASALDEILRRAGTARNARLRKLEELVASYLQRYCVKNDTIGFFGPVGWAELRDEGEPVAVRTGPRLLARRQVFFESWAIDALAARLAGEPGLRPSLVPRLRLGCSASARSFHPPGGQEVALTPEQAAVIAECDGRRSAREIAVALSRRASRRPAGTAAEVCARLAELAEQGIVTWTLEVPLELRPEEALRRRLAAVEPAALRRKVLAPLLELDKARRRLARAAGDGKQVERAMRQLEQTFTRLTGVAARRLHGRFYAARGLVYEECRRAAAVTFGPELTRRLHPLSYVLEAARWLAGELARRVDRRLRELHDLLREGGEPAVDSFTFFSRGLASIFYKPERDACLVALERELQERWAGVLGLPSTATRLDRTSGEIAERFAAAFGQAGPAWSLVRYFSPDVMIAARGESAFRAGDFQVVLGEIHASNTLSWSCFVSQHPHPERLLANVEHDLAAATVVLPQMLKTIWPQRMNSALVPPWFLRYEVAEQAPSRPECRTLPAAEVIVERDDLGLTVRSRDGQIRFPALELFGLQLTEECSRLLGKAFGHGGHQPRITLDELVIARERWQVPAADLQFAAQREPLQRLLATRRWARRHRLPRFCFYRAAGEAKPCYLDLDSPIYVDIFCRLVRKALAEHGQEPLAIAEMLPAIEDAWLTDAEGSSYTCELRMAALPLRRSTGEGQVPELTRRRG
jgi:hypothetical protein